MTRTIVCSRVLAASALLAGTALTCPAPIPGVLPNGNWGGEHMGMVAADTGATLEYDCAHGTISGPLRVSPDGSFDWQGLHYVDHGGPVYQGEPPNVHPARYTGHATARSIDVTRTLTDGYAPPASFHLDFGANPRVFKCL